jgi:hypothetical protein
MQQVDDFAIAAPDKKASDILLNLIDEQVSIPLKRQGLAFQMWHFIKIDCHTYINKLCKKYLNSWLSKVPRTLN